MSMQAYWIALAATAGAAGGVSASIGYSQLAPMQAMASVADVTPAINRLHSDLIALQQDLVKQGAASADQSATLRGMQQIMVRGENARLEQQVKVQAAESKRHYDYQQVLNSAPSVR